jgi:replicative DNA helicase
MSDPFSIELPHPVSYWRTRWEEEEPQEALSTGLPSLDEALGGGLIAGQVMTVGASTGCGKSSFGINLACRVAERGLPAVFFTFEMTVQSLAARVNQTYSGVNGTKIQTKNMTEKEVGYVADADEYISDLPLYITGGDYLNPDNIATIMKRFVDEIGAELFVFDYIQRMNTASVETRQFGIEAAMTAIDHAAKYVVQKPICILSQLNRAAGKSGEPTRYDLRDSGSIENASDIVMLIDPVEDRPMSGWHEPVDFNFIVDKQRSGGGGVVPVTFLPHRVSFVEDD